MAFHDDRAWERSLFDQQIADAQRHAQNQFGRALGASQHAMHMQEQRRREAREREIAIEESKKPKTFRQELQAETDRWLK